MALLSPLLSGNLRLAQAADGIKSINRLNVSKSNSVDKEAVQKLQRALDVLKCTPANSFKNGEWDGDFGQGTVDAVVKFQRQTWPNPPEPKAKVWDGIVGKNTLAKMDAALAGKAPPVVVPPVIVPPVIAIAGPGTPIRLRFMQICKEVLKPYPQLTALGTGGIGTGCGHLPGTVFAKVPVIPPDKTGAFKERVKQEGKEATLYLTSPTTWWKELAQTVDQKYAPARKCWVPFGAGSRPLPGDIYLLAQYANPAYFAHVGIIVDASGSTWMTADGGQGNGWQAGFVKRQFEPDGTMTGENGKKARLKGWVDLDSLLAVAVAVFPTNLAG